MTHTITSLNECMRTNALIRGPYRAASAMLVLACLCTCAAPRALGDATEEQPLEKGCVLRVNYTGTTALENFPLMVRISEGDGSSFSYSDAEADGSDVRFYARSGEVLDHEIALWNVSGESIAYVSVPTMHPGLSIVMRWKKRSSESELPAVDAQAVWTKAGYLAVWHFDSYAGGFANSAGDGLAAVAQSGTEPPPVVSGIAGGAADIAKTHPLKATSSGVSLAKPFSISCWTYFSIPSSQMARNAGRIWTTGTAYSQANFFFNAHQEYIMGDGGYTNLGTGHCKSNVWQHLTAVYCGAESKVYLDDQTLATGANAPTSDSKSYTLFGIGGWTETTADSENNFAGTMDELRIRLSDTSQEWAAAEYASAQSGFVTPFNLDCASSLRKGAVIAAAGLSDSVSLTNFPLMVKLSATNDFDFAYSQAAEDGSDVRFFDEWGVPLNHEVAFWNTSGESVLYVCVPILTRNTLVEMRWNRKSPSADLPPTFAEAVWSAAGYMAVWHLDRYDSAIGGYANSASSSFVAKPVSGGAAPVAVPGAQGPGAGIYATAPLVATDTTGVYLVRPYSVSCWSRYPTDVWHCGKSDGRIWTCGTVNTVVNVFFNWFQGVVMGDSLSYMMFQSQVMKEGETSEERDARVLRETLCKKDTWQFVTGVYKADDSRTYLDGVNIPDPKGKTDIESDDSVVRKAFGLGGYTNAGPSATEGNGNFRGEIDEVRVRSGVASAEWVKAEYDNATNPSFVAFTRLRTFGTAVYVR